MSDKTHSQLKEEATALGLSFKGNTSKEALEGMIEDFYEAEASESVVKAITMEETVEDIPELPRALSKKVNAVRNVGSNSLAIRQLVSEAKKQAFKKRVVTISSNDTRDNQHVTAIPLFFENQYFALDRIVPLNIPVELEQCLIDIAKSTTIAIHKKGSVDGGRTVGNTAFAKKFNISYEDTDN